jgi:hypothetical protein
MIFDACELRLINSVKKDMFCSVILCMM